MKNSLPISSIRMDTMSIKKRIIAIILIAAAAMTFTIIHFRWEAHSAKFDPLLAVLLASGMEHNEFTREGNRFVSGSLSPIFSFEPVEGAQDAKRFHYTVARPRYLAFGGNFSIAVLNDRVSEYLAELTYFPGNGSLVLGMVQRTGPYNTNSIGMAIDANGLPLPRNPQDSDELWYEWSRRYEVLHDDVIEMLADLRLMFSEELFR